MATRKKKRQLPPWLLGVSVPNTSARRSVDENKEHSENTCTSNKKYMFENSDIPCSVKAGASTGKLGASDHVEEKVTVEKLVEMSYKEYSFPGSIIYCHNKDDCNIICDDILKTVGETEDCFIGFDTEWPVTYQKGKQAPTALIQLCLNLNKCYLFHISCMYKLPVMLRKLIELKNIKKVGLNVEYDLWKLEMDYDIKAKEVIQNSAVELKNLANAKLRSAENWSLEGLSKNVLRLRISKDPKIRTCDWTQYPLPEEQQRYAATDAIISLMIHKKLTGS